MQSGHLVSQRGRTGGTFVAERPPLAEQDDKPLGEEAWAVLDYRVAIEAGATILAAERAEADQLERLGELVAKMAGATDFEEYRRADMRFHIGIAEAARSPRLVARDDRGPGADERPDRPDRASRSRCSRTRTPSTGGW